MAGSVNKVILIGNLGRDPEVRTFQNGGKVCNLSIATSDTWKDKDTGERREQTEWHTVSIFTEGLIGIAEQYLRKGSKVYIEGKMKTRKWQDQQTGQDRYTTDVVIPRYNGELILLGPRIEGGGDGDYGSSGGGYGDYGGNYISGQVDGNHGGGGYGDGQPGGGQPGGGQPDNSQPGGGQPGDDQLGGGQVQGGYDDNPTGEGHVGEGHVGHASEGQTGEGHAGGQTDDGGSGDSHFGQGGLDDGDDIPF